LKGVELYVSLKFLRVAYRVDGISILLKTSIVLPQDWGKGLAEPSMTKVLPNRQQYPRSAYLVAASYKPDTSPFLISFLA
jgi:hypothetical protein